jgi:hypothetical protein
MEPVVSPFQGFGAIATTMSQVVALGCDVSDPSGRMFFVPRSRTAGSIDWRPYGNKVVRSES